MYSALRFENLIQCPLVAEKFTATLQDVTPTCVYVCVCVYIYIH